MYDASFMDVDKVEIEHVTLPPAPDGSGNVVTVKLRIYSARSTNPENITLFSRRGAECIPFGVGIQFVARGKEAKDATSTPPAPADTGGYAGV